MTRVLDLAAVPAIIPVLACGSEVAPVAIAATATPEPAASPTATPRFPTARTSTSCSAQQEGVCNGCRTEFPFRIFEVDHVIPQSRGGIDHLENLQLLCPSCNRIKGDRPMEYLAA